MAYTETALLIVTKKDPTNLRYSLYDSDALTFVSRDVYIIE